jgi:hypothetical protein
MAAAVRLARRARLARRPRAVRLLGYAPATSGGVMTPDEIRSISDERDRQLALRLDAWREGYDAGAAGQFEAGYAAAIADVKAAQHGLYNHLRRCRETEDGRWIVRGQQRTRKTFGNPHPADYPGKRDAA